MLSKSQDFQDRKCRVLARWLSYASVTFALFISAIVAGQSGWMGSADVHTFLEVCSTLVAFAVGIVAILRFYARKSNLLLFLGVGFIGTGFLDGYHCLVTHTHFCDRFPSARLSLAPWSWNASRMFHATWMVLAWWTTRHEYRAKRLTMTAELSVYAIVAFLTVSCFAFFAFVPLPSGYYPDLLLSRPQELFSGTLLLVATVGLLRQGDWKKDTLSYWVVLSLIVGVAAQTEFMSRSRGLFDAMFDVAHVLKILSYACVLAGLMFDAIQLFRRAEQSVEELQSVALFFRSVLDSVDAQMCILDSSGAIIETNAAWDRDRRSRGLSIRANYASYADELRSAGGKRSRATKMVARAIDRVLSGEETSATLEYEQVTESGESRWLEASVSPLREHNFGRVVITQTNITARKVAEKEKLDMSNRLVEVSRQAGMAEVATGILHNVGNVLNSVNVSANLTREKLSASRVTTLENASDMIQQHTDDLGEFVTSDPRGRHFPGLLHQLSVTLCEERDSNLKELGALADNIEHVKEIIRMQQTFACVTATSENVDLTGLVEDALKINDAGLIRHCVDVVREFDDLSPVVTERHKVLQIVVNLISNAKYALSDSDRLEKTMTLVVASDDTGVLIEVRDNGVGIRDGDLDRIFTHGFTTRDEGHGFGLHSCALAAQELGGTLTCQSDGAGTGARFTLRLPVERESRCKV